MKNTSIKKLTPCIIAVVVIGAGSFFVGMQYGRTSSNGQGTNLSPEERQARMANFNGGQRTGGMRTGSSNGLIAGEIMSKDATGITVKLRDGGSKIVFISDATKIMKPISGTTTDLTVGAQITAIGSPNPDGSISAQSVQLRTDIPQSKTN